MNRWISCGPHPTVWNREPYDQPCDYAGTTRPRFTARVNIIGKYTSTTPVSVGLAIVMQRYF